MNTERDRPESPRGGAASAPRPWPRVGAVRRLGPALLVVAALVVAGVVATMQSGGSGVATGSAGTAPAPLRAGAGASLPVTYQMAEKAGRAADYHWPAGCDPTTGRLAVPTVFAPPCVPVFSGDNGGATASGVTGSTITVVFYVAPPGDLAAQFAGAAGDPATNIATAEAYVAMLNHIVTLYGRHVQLLPYNATGTSTDAVAARADAIRVAQQLHAFASINGPGQTTAYQDELARLHVLCLSCGVGAPYSELQQDAPYVWALLPTSDTVLTESFRYVVNQLMNRNAVYAGDPQFRARKRKFALVSYDQNPPIYSSTTARLDREFANSHLTFALNEKYLLDLSNLPTEAATIAEHLKSSGATTVVFAGDPIMPIYLTKACAAIGYYPEWVITGTVFTYTSAIGRLYDQKEWSHAFGTSVLAVPTPVQTGDAYRLYDWYYGGVPAAAKTAVVILPPILELFDGLELAGPRLTGLTFAEGTFRYPPTGGGPTAPEISFGYQGAPPLPSYTSPSDYTFVWYDATAQGEDEEGVDGTGLIRYVDGGRRYPASGGPSTEVPMFRTSGSITMFATPPPVDRPPSYPPWPGSPKAGG
jgi:Periplasmic binding protein